MTVKLGNGTNDGIECRLNSANTCCTTVPNLLPSSYLKITKEISMLTLWVCCLRFLHPVER
jgi:hypothetical protein